MPSRRRASSHPPDPGPPAEVAKLERELIAVMRRHKARLHALEEIDVERNRAIRAAHAGGVKRKRIVELTELTAQRIDQIRRDES